jgi:diguanylate cyclase (GGDEF)-like protein
LASLFRDVVAEQSVDSVLTRVLATLRELVRCEDVVVWECLGDGELAVALVDGDDEEAMRSLRIRFGEGLTGKAALERRAVASNDAHVDPAAGLVPGTQSTPEAIVCMPLLARDRLLGVLSLYRRGASRAFAPEEIDLVADFAAVAALALDNARTRCELERLATTDELTGLPNRRHFQSELEREIATASRYGAPLSLLLLDLDNFKAINDTYGHGTGDRTLAVVAKEIQQCLRAPDLVARLGGDEFAVLLPQTDRIAAESLVERLQTTVREAVTAPLTISVSIGISTLTGGDAADLLEDADRFLYEAKRADPAPASVRFEASNDAGAATQLPRSVRRQLESSRAAKTEQARRSVGVLDRHEKILAGRYCHLSEAGYPPLEALAIAENPHADLEDLLRRKDAHLVNPSGAPLTSPQ